LLDNFKGLLAIKSSINSALVDIELVDEDSLERLDIVDLVVYNKDLLLFEVRLLVLLL